MFADVSEISDQSLFDEETQSRFVNHADVNYPPCLVGSQIGTWRARLGDFSESQIEERIQQLNDVRVVQNAAFPR